MSNVRQSGGLDPTSISTSTSSSATEASSASASCKVRKVLNVVRPRKLCTHFGRDIGRENKHRVNTRMAGSSEAHDSRMQGSAKSNGLGEGQSIMSWSCDDAADSSGPLVKKIMGKSVQP